MSLVWCIGDHQEELTTKLPELQNIANQILINYPENNFYNYVTYLECKCGNKLFTFNLS